MRCFPILLVLLLASCSKEPSTFIPAPRSIATAEQVRADASKWASQDANRYWSAILPTGSMKPFVDEHSIALCVRYTGQSLSNGAVVIYRRDTATPRVIHVVSDQNAESVYMSGYANRQSDGWYPKSSIEGIMVGQFYLP